MAGEFLRQTDVRSLLGYLGAFEMRGCGRDVFRRSSYLGRFTQERTVLRSQLGSE